MSDQDRISPFNTSTISSRQVMRIKKIINTEIMSYRSNTKFSKLTSKELYSRHQGWPKGNFSFKNIILFSSRLVKGKERKASLKRYCFIQHYIISDYLSHNKYMMKSAQSIFKSWRWRLGKDKSINPWHHNISKYILHNVHHTFPKALSRWICWTIKSFFSWWSIPLFLWP